MLRALIVDDQPLACDGLGALVRVVGPAEVAGQGLRAVEAQGLRRERTDVVFGDVQMPGVKDLERRGPPAEAGPARSASPDRGAASRRALPGRGGPRPQLERAGP